MNASAPGWLPDPSGRHEYRYWDGGRWTDDVADRGTAAIDPLAGPAEPGAAGDEATTVMDPTQSFTPAAGAGSGPGAPGPDAGAPRGGPATPAAGYGPSPGQAAPGGGPLASGAPGRSGPRTGLLIGLGLLALALVVGIVVALAGGDEDGSTAARSGPGPREPGTTGSGSPRPDTGDDTSDPSVDLGGDIDLDDPDVREAIIDLVADQLEGQGFTRDEAECFTGAMLDGLGAGRLAEIGESGGDMSALTADDYSSLFDAALACGVPGPPAGADD